MVHRIVCVVGRPGWAGLLAATLFAAGLAACDSSGGVGGGGVTQPCGSYSLAVTAGSVDLAVNAQTTLSAKVGTCSSKRVLWAVTDSSVLGVTATSDTSAIVTGRAKGVATVLARLQADSLATQHQTVIQVQ